MYVANTAYHWIVEIPVALNPDRSVSVAARAQVLTTVSTHPTALRSTATTISGSHANQQDEIDVITPTSSRRKARSQRSSPSGGDLPGRPSEDGTVSGAALPGEPGVQP